VFLSSSPESRRRGNSRLTFFRGVFQLYSTPPLLSRPGACLVPLLYDSASPDVPVRGEFRGSRWLFSDRFFFRAPRPGSLGTVTVTYPPIFVTRIDSGSPLSRGGFLSDPVWRTALVSCLLSPSLASFLGFYRGHLSLLRRRRWSMILRKGRCQSFAQDSISWVVVRLPPCFW